MKIEISVLERESLLSWLAGAVNPKTIKLKSVKELAVHLSGGGTILVWENGVSKPRSSANPLVFVRSDDKDDFLAWVSTYVTTFAPFSAFFRVLTEKNLSLFELCQQPQLFEESLSTEKLASIAIAEAVSEFHDVASARRLSLSSCESTFSYSVLRALAAGYKSEDIIQLSTAWNAARDIISDDDQQQISFRIERSALLDNTVDFWRLITESGAKLFTKEKPTSKIAFGMIGDLILSCGEGREVSNKVFDTIVQKISGNTEQPSLMSKVSKEKQVKFFDESVHSFSRSKVPESVRNALIGFSAARLANGSFEYLSLLAENRQNLLGVYPWFAYFSTYQPEFDGLTIFQNLGRRIARKIPRQMDLFNSELFDLSLDEMRVQLKQRRLMDLRVDSSPLMQIEIMPYVPVKFRAGTSEKEEAIVGKLNSDRTLKRVRSALEGALYELNIMAESSERSYSKGASKRYRR